MPIRLVIADDHAVVRQGLRMFLLDDPEFEVIAEPQHVGLALGQRLGAFGRAHFAHQTRRRLGRKLHLAIRRGLDGAR